MVYLNSKTRDRYNKLNPLILTKFGSAELGQYIPKVVVSSPDQMQVLGSLKYKSINKSSANSFATRMKKLIQGKSTSRNQSYKGSLKWPSRSRPGSTYKGAFKELNSQHLVLSSSQGVLRVPRSDLTSPAIDFAKAIQQGQDNRRQGNEKISRSTKQPSLTPKPVVSTTKSNYFKPLTWTNNNNQSMLGTLVSFNKGVVRVRLANGNVKSCNIAELTPASQTQARKEAAYIRHR